MFNEFNEPKTQVNSLMSLELIQMNILSPKKPHKRSYMK